MLKLLYIAFILFLIPSAFAADLTYEIKPGDELMHISKKVYGTYHRWNLIQKANPGIQPTRLVIGQKIVIPAVPDRAIASIEEDEFTAQSVVALLPETEAKTQTGFLSFFKRTPAEVDDIMEMKLVDEKKRYKQIDSFDSL